MYRALYRKWRPQRFEDVVAQHGTVTALRNQVAAGRVGHAYLFTGVRGTGKTTCAKIFAKAVNCLNPHDGDPCCQCSICRGIDDGSILDVVEMDAASNNGVDDIRGLRDETAYTPSECRYKVYIIDEVHMLSTAAFNALLKTLEEPPAHVIFILATTEIQKVPETILSRCQRYDFARIVPEDIARRVEYIAGEEHLQLTTEGAELISRLADGAMRDALSILDTCAGVTSQIDASVVRKMAGVTDRSYLFRISDAIAAQDGATALACLAQLRQQDSVDIKRLTDELIAHYRALMLAALPGGQALLTGVSPEEEALYLQKGPALGQREPIRAIRLLGNALEHMARGSDQRIELELALVNLAEPLQPVAQPIQAVPARASAAPAPEPPQPFAAAQAQPQPFVSAPAAPVVTAPAAPQEPAPAPAVQEEAPPIPEEPPVQESAAALPWEEPAPPMPLAEPVPEPPATAAPAPMPQQPKADCAADPALDRPRKVAAAGINPFDKWSEVIHLLQEKDPMLYTYLKKSKAYFDGTRVLIDGGKTFRDFIRANKDSQKLIKKLIAQVSGVAVPIGPYEPQAAGETASNAEESLHKLEQLGLDVSIEDTDRKKKA